MGPEQSDPISPRVHAHWMRNGFCILWLILLGGVTVLLAVGGRPDPAGSGQTLDGAWRFHAGDDARWADPAADDRSWDRIALVSRPEVHDGDVGIPGYLEGWRARGHPDLEGFGWYRRQVTLPPRGDLVLIGPPAVDDAYEAYWNGQRIGGVGLRAGSHDVTATRPALMPIPAEAKRTGVLAIRAFMQPGIGRDGQSGGLRTVPVLASRAEGAALYRAQWRRTIAGYVVDVVEPAAMLVLALIAGFAAPTLARPAFARWMAVALVVSACTRLGNAIIAWTDLVSLSTLLWIGGTVLTPLAKLVWTLAWNQWGDGSNRRPIALGAVIAWIAMLAGAIAHSPLLAGMGRAAFALLLAAIAIRIARRGEQRWLALAAMLFVAIGLFAGDLSTLGVPGIWFPFNIGVSRSQYAYALALPLLAFALFAADRAFTSRAVRPADAP